MEKKNKLGITGPVMMYVVMFLAYALKNFHSYATSMTASLLQTDLGLTAAQVSLYIAAYTWTNAIVQLRRHRLRPVERQEAARLLVYRRSGRLPSGCLLRQSRRHRDRARHSHRRHLLRL